MNNILDKINKAYELEAKKVELGKHEVELAAIDELLALVNKSRDVSSEMVNNYLESKKFAQISINASKLHLKNLDSISKLVNNIKSQGENLGIDVTKIKEWRNAYDFLNENPKNATEVMIKKLESLK